MKKLGMLLVLFSLCVFTVGCNGDNGATDLTPDDTTVEPENGSGMDEPMDTTDETDTPDTTDANGG